MPLSYIYYAYSLRPSREVSDIFPGDKTFYSSVFGIIFFTYFGISCFDAFSSY